MYIFSKSNYPYFPGSQKIFPGSPMLGLDHLNTELVHFRYPLYLQNFQHTVRIEMKKVEIIIKFVLLVNNVSSTIFLRFQI